MKGKIIVAIDGFASCGKSTLAKALAAKLGYVYVDTGAMYRAATLYFLRKGISLDDKVAIEQALQDIHVRFEHTALGNRTILNEEDVEREIREMYVSDWVSQVSAISAVRRAMVRQQQAMGAHRGLVMDGRDIGTVVFKDAELKLFLTADNTVRIERRLAELQAKGVHISREAVSENLALRDHIDSTREDSPLRQATDAVVIDNSQMTPDMQLNIALELALDRIKATASA